MKRLTTYAAALVLGAGSLGLAACGDDDDDSAASENTPAEMAPAETAPSAEEGVEVGGEMMLPSLTIAENASNAPNLSTLVSAVEAAGLVETLNGPGPFTVFAPTNDAFEKVDAAALESLLQPENKEELTSVLTYHVVPGEIFAADLEDGQELETVQGETLTVSIDGDTVKVNDAVVETPDIRDSNGVSHVIDTVLMPGG